MRVQCILILPFVEADLWATRSDEILRRTFVEHAYTHAEKNTLALSVRAFILLCDRCCAVLIALCVNCTWLFLLIHVWVRLHCYSVLWSLKKTRPTIPPAPSKT